MLKSYLNIVAYAMVRVVMYPMVLLYHRFSVKWTEPVPEDRRVIIACNHTSFLDPLLVGLAFPRRLRYLAKEEIFRVYFLSWIVRTLGAVPVSRETNAAAASSLKSFLKFLKEGSDVLIFPEGARSLDGKLLPLEAGVAVVACHSQAPILPAFIKGAYEAMPPGSAIIKPAKITITFGKLITLEPEAYKEKGARDKIMASLSDAFKTLESSS